VSTRTYLSIGDVLTLLREEFPDVTISKIRFLESQGLVNPERSPSGYRKFFEHDVERLRWVLRQQREHFLPLKVIRDRLADGELDDTDATEGADETDASNGKPAATHVPQQAHATAVAGATSHGQAGATSYAGDTPTKADEEAMARILADASRRAAARLPDDAPGERGLQVVDDASAATGTAAKPSTPAQVSASTVANASAPTSGADAHSQAGRSGRGAAQAPGSPGGRATASRGWTDNGAGSPEAPTGPPGATGATGATGAGSGAGQGAARKSPAHASARVAADASAEAVVTGASLTAAELAAASGLSPDEVAGLVSFGLIEPVLVAGIDTYDEDALTVANLAASFSVYGIEARHLRLFRNAVDREVGLIEQVVIPLLRQRNPESRQRALDAAEDLGALGQSMRATLLKQALRRHLGG
jgi:DNA-binding transcriptional MerR regulator